MPTSNVRISERSRSILKDLAAAQSASMQQVLEQAIEAYHRERFLEELNSAFLRLRSDPEAWSSEEEERRAWDKALQDGIEGE